MEPRGVSLASRVHAAPALLRDTTNERGARDDADDAQTSKSRWKKVATLGLAFAGNLAGGGSAAGANALVATETWQDATSSEDEGSVRRYEHSDDSDVDAEGIETELTAAVPPRCKTFDASGIRMTSSKNDKDEGADATDVVWAYQNLTRVPPGLWRAFHPERLRVLDVSHNALTTLPSALGRFVNLESLDCSSNRIKKLPPSLARCRRLRALVASRNRLRRLGGWTCVLPKLKRLECGENPELIDPPEAIVNRGGLAVLEYLRAANVALTWKPSEVVHLSRFATAEKEASRVSLEAATRETRRHERLWDMDARSVFDDGPSLSDTSQQLSERKVANRTNAGFALSVAWLQDSGSVPAPNTERARRVLKETASRNAGVDLRYVAFRPGFFATFRRVAKIDLTDARLVSLPPALGTLCAHLETLILDGNYFSIASPPRETEGPPSTADASCAVPDLTRLPKLKTLSMRNCKNITTLPPWIGQCAALETLVVSTCALRAAPAEVEGPGAADKTSPSRRNVPLREKLPSLRGACSLRTLDVSRNGKLRSLPRLPSCLRTLNCSECALEDLNFVTDATDLRELDAHENRASRLPEDLADLDFLRAFDVRRNFLKSLDAPNMERRARFFTKLHFSSNPLAHTPWWLADVPTEALEPRAELEKRVAFEVADLYRADAFDQGGDDGVDGLSLSSLIGDDDAKMRTRTPSLRHAFRATKIDLRSRGVLYAPSLLQFSASLTHLVLSGNHLAFLPEHVSECVRLKVLDASRNELAFLPDLGKLCCLEDLRASENRLQKLPDSLSKCVALRSLYVGKNPELETVPDLKKCVSLETLVIDACALRVLPVTLAAAPRLTRLYVEGNPLTFPGPEVYEKGGNPAVLKFIRDVYRTAEESREMREAREAFAAGAEEEKNKDADASGEETKQKQNKTSLGALLWRDARRVVVRDETDETRIGDSSRYEDGAFDAENALLRAREMTAGVRAAEAEKLLASSVAELESARSDALEFGEEVSRLVASVRSLRVAAEEQRRLLSKFPTMATDFLAALQARLRDEKKALRLALDSKDAADTNALRLHARVAEREATFAALTEAVRLARAAKEEVSVRRREAIMRSRAKSVSETRKTATEGAAKAIEAELVSRSLRKTSRALVKRESSRRRMGGEHFDLGLRRADVTQFRAIEDKANRAWGRAQAALWMGAFRKPTIRAEYSAAETEKSEREGPAGRTR